MSSFFVVQVKSGRELFVKDMMMKAFERSCIHHVKAIYAMESYTNVIDQFDSLADALKEEQVSEYLHFKRIKYYVQKLREIIYDNQHTEQDTLNMLESYQQDIREVTARLKAMRNSQMTIVVKGYILIETVDTHNTLPVDLWHTIKSIPNVIGFPSRYNVPVQEVQTFFEQIEMTEQIEVELNEVQLTLKEFQLLERNLLEQVNDVANPMNETEMEDILKHVSTTETVEEQLTAIVAEIEMNRSSHISTQKIKRLLSNVKSKVVQNKSYLCMPLALYKELYQYSFPKHFTKRFFLQQIQTYIQSIINQTSPPVLTT